MRFRVLSLFLAGSLSLGALSACAEQDPIDEVPAFDVETASVQLIDAGSGDKRQLSYTGAEQDTGVEVSYGIGQDAVAADKVSPEAPAGGDVEQVTLPLTVTAVEGGGFDATVGTPKHSNLDLGKEALTAEGFRMRWTADARGMVSDVKLLPPDGSSDDGRAVVERAMLQILGTQPVFPTEEVGEGATWTVTSRTTGETNMKRTSTYTVDTIDGDMVTLSLEIADEPTQKELDLEGAEKLTAEEWTTTSEATITVDLTKPIPVGGQNAATTRIVYSGPNPDFKVVQDVTTATTYGE